MFKMPRATAFLLLCVGLQAGALDLQVEARADRQTVERERESQALQIQPKMLSCAPPSPLPIGPPGGMAAGAFPASWGNDDALTVTLWREPCQAGAGAILYLRVVPTAGTPFVCSSAFAVLQNSTQYDLKLVQTTAGSSFCNDLLAPVTLAVDQWSFDPLFDQAAPFTLVFKGVFANFPGAVLGFNGERVKAQVTVELSDFEEGNMRGAINYYNDNPSAPFLRLVLEERTFARYSKLAADLGMTAPPPR